MTPERKGWIDVARGMACVLVVVHHSNNFLKHQDLDAEWWDTVSNATGHIRMPLFFLASGLVAGSAVRRSWRGLVRTRLLLMVWLVLAWTVVSFVLSRIEPRIGSSRGDTTTVADLGEELFRPITEIWFLEALLVYLVLAKLLRRVPTALLLGAAGVLSIAVGSWLVETGNFAWDSTGSDFVFFVLGLRGRDVLVRAVERAAPWHAPVAVAGFVTAVVVLAETDTWGHPVTVLPVSVLGVVAALTTADRIASTASGRVLMSLGRQTLPVFLLHVTVIGLVVIVWSSLSGPASAPVAAVSPLLLTVVVITLVLGAAHLLGRVPGAFAPPAWLVRAFDAPGRERKDALPAPAPSVLAGESVDVGGR